MRRGGLSKARCPTVDTGLMVTNCIGSWKGGSSTYALAGVTRTGGKESISGIPRYWLSATCAKKRFSEAALNMGRAAFFFFLD